MQHPQNTHCTSTSPHRRGGGEVVNEHDQYFYHSDHLGSSSFISDLSGAITQHLQYLPFGETFIEQRNTSNYYTPYKFNAKELDEESGLYYYGARYYDPRTSVWLGVDPLADKTPNISPFTYCLNNPIKLVDPDGRTPWPIAQVFNGGVRRIISGMFRNYGGTFHGGVDIVHKSNVGNLSGGPLVGLSVPLRSS